MTTTDMRKHPTSAIARLQLKCQPFDFRQLVFAHGWVQLAPFNWDDATQALHRCLTLNGRSCHVTMQHQNATDKVLVRATLTPNPGRTHHAEARRQVTRMLRLDEDFSPFHACCRRDRHLRIVAERGWGGMLRCPTAFEDVIKTICTANCHWRNTCTMCERLCALGGGAFPSPKQLIDIGPRRLSHAAPVGYRAETIVNVARLTEEGQMPLDTWMAEGNIDRVRSTLRQIKGIGDYCVNHMMVLLGIYDRLPVDSEVIKHLRDTYHGGRRVPASVAVRRFEPFDAHAFLAYKFGRIAAGARAIRSPR